ncbi:GNAT family N-acetyltransferase [Actinophytocola glycyrrhizae]|uniref:GNAT family N-acetyltransferase n=1 Tax=Actinophytocola glycyrrhizae TaxID=2044873 RepID=A0ABV9S8Z6_9PSEU
MTEGTRLRPVTEPDLDRLDEMFADPALIGEFNWGGFSDPGLWRRRFAENGLLTDDKSVLMVEAEGATAGFVSWERVRTGHTAYVHQIGISLLPAARGRGLGAAAQLLLARYLFAHSPGNRIQAATEAGNIAEQRSLEKAGFVREAVLKEHTFRDGAWRDEVLYRMLRSELPA